MEQRIYKCILAALIGGILLCAGLIAYLLLRPDPQAEAFTDAILVWEEFQHAIA